MKQDRAAMLRERLAGSKFAQRADEIVDMASGKEAFRIGMPVEVTQKSDTMRVAPNGRDFHVRIAASTEAVARDSGIIPITAWESGGLKNFVANPIILAFHKHTEPIGRSVHTEINGGELRQYWEFHGESETSRLMQTLYERGFMKAASVGFIVHDYQFIDELSEKEYEALQKKYGAAVKDIYWIAQRAELLETSAVPVPSDPRALQFDFAARNAEAIGIDTSILRKFTARSETMSTTASPASPAPATTAAPAVVRETTAVAPAAVVVAPAAEVRTVTQETLDAAIAAVRAEFSAKFAALEKAAPVSTPAAPSAAGEGEREVEIEVLPGENKDQAIERYVNAALAREAGAPQSRSTK